MVAKIDLEKAYDHLEWPFIRFTLQFFNFPQQIIDLIMACLETSSILVMWNGQTSKPFNPSRGVHQGDPLSPYLFILCLNHLSLLLDSALHTKSSQQAYILFNIFKDF